MLLKSIALENIRSYTSQTVRFPSGSTLLAGDIGSGKSTILLALEFALFGISKGIISGDALLRNGKKEGSVELVMSIEGKEVRIRRTLKKQNEGVQQSSGFIEMDGKRKELTAVELKSLISDILGYPKESLSKKSLVYRYTVYCPQEEMKQILFDEPEHRLDTLRKVFGIDRYKRIAANSMILSRRFKEQKKELNGKILDLDQKQSMKHDINELVSKLKANMENIRPALEKTRKDMNDRRKSVEQAEKMIKELDGFRNSLDLAKNSMQSKRSLIEKQDNDIKRTEMQIAELNKRLSAIHIDADIEKKDAANVEQELSAKESELEQLTRKRIESSQQLSTLSKRHDELKAEIAGKELAVKELSAKKQEMVSLRIEFDRIDSIKKEIENTENDIQELRSSISRHEADKANSIKIKDSITGISTCPTCLQQLNSMYKLRVIERENDVQQSADQHMKALKSGLDAKAKLLNELKARQESLMEKRLAAKSLEAEIASLESIEKEILDKRKQLSDSGKQLSELRSAADSVTDEQLSGLRRYIFELKAVLKKVMEARAKSAEKKEIVSSIDEKSRLNEELAKLNADALKEESELLARISSLSSRIAQFSGIEESHGRMRKELNDLMQLDRSNDIRMVSVQKEIEGYSNNILIIQKEIDDKLRSKAQLEKASQYIDWIENYFVNLMAAIEKNVFSKAYRNFNSIFQEWFNILVDDEILNARLDPLFTPVVEQNGYETGIEQLSGGEKTALALAYRLALNKVINSIISTIKTRDIIILDEPTDGFSSEQLDRIREVLDELGTQQTIIVSHESKIESFVDNVLRISKHEHVSVVE